MLRGGRVALSLALLLAPLTAAGCAASRGVPASRVLRGDIDDLDPASLALAAERSAAALAKMPDSRSFEVGGSRVSPGELAASAGHVASLARSARDATSLTASLAKDCVAVRSGDDAKVTAYYEPQLVARPAPDRRFHYPLYRLPSDAQMEELRRRLGRTPTRADIDERGVLAGMGLEIAWVDDPVARFFLHVQGSGRLDFGGGRFVRVGFAGTNGLAYRSAGALMLGRGLLERGGAGAPAMREWLTSHPERRDALLAENARYVFFRDTASDGPVGALGTKLVAGRSIAVDERHVPRGVLAWLRTTRPIPGPTGRACSRTPLTRFVFAQDAGAAIEGPARVDLFAGSGEEAGYEAGLMNEGGELYLLLCGPARRR